MKRYFPLVAGIIGIVAMFALLPLFETAQPRGVRLTRAQAAAIADRAASQRGIPVARAWSNIVWTSSSFVEKELERDPKQRRRAADDPVIGPRLGAYKINYYRRGVEKWNPYGYVAVSGRTGEVLSARLRQNVEDRGAALTEATLRPRADAFVQSRTFPGAPSPHFEQARPTVQRNRTDWVFRYRVPSAFPIGNVVPYLNVFFEGDRFSGWELAEEYADGHAFKQDNVGDVGMTFVKFIVMLVGLLVLLVMFLKKYHAGEVGVGTGTFLFAVTIVLAVAFCITIAPSASQGSQFGSIDAQQTSWALIGFMMLFIHLPLAVLVFLGWSVGESYARERWGERLASFDALLRRDPFNATVGRSILHGLLLAPAAAAAALLVGAIPLLLGMAHAGLGDGSQMILYLGGPVAVLLASAFDSILYSIVGILFVLAFSSRRRALPVGILTAIVVITVSGSLAEVPVAPIGPRVLFGWGGIAAIVAIFLLSDLLTTVVALFEATIIAGALPLLAVARGDLFSQMMVVLAVPLLLMAAYAMTAMMTKREVVYSYEDLAPHVKRIVERERVKAEIDAANRIQAALLPFDAPLVAGATVASHYRAATEIGGDYFDFLPQATGEVGIAFGDVSGHGLTSGIVMAMAKAALLVQVDHDPSPRVVMNVLNDIVIKTAPKRIMMTFFFGLLDPTTQQLRFSSAGHLDPYVYRADGRKLESLSSWGFPLGVRRRDPFREHVVEFLPGDRLVLYSDGLIEAVDDDGEPFGFDRFEQVLRDSGHLAADDIKKTLLNTIRKFTRNRPPEDDQTLVVVSFEEPASGALARFAVEERIEQVH